MSKRIGRLILGDTPLSPMAQANQPEQASASASAETGGQCVPPQPTQGFVAFEPRTSEGVSVADRPRQRQVGCETCGQSLEPYEDKVRCSVCNLWIHVGCVEILSIGYSWRAEMCLACQQKSTRKRRVIKALELRRGSQWDGDQWFRDLQVNVRNNGEYGI